MPNLKQIIHNLPNPVLVVNRQRRVVLTNKATQEFSGQPEKNLINKRGGDILGCVHTQAHEKGCGYSESCQWCPARTAVLACFDDKADIEAFEMTLDSRLDGPRDLKIAVTYLPSDDLKNGVGSDELAILTVDDLTEFKKREKAAAALETVGAICHELNQPLTVGLGQLSLLRMKIGENKQIDSLSDQLRRMGDITRKLMDLNNYQTRHYTAGVEILDIHKSSNECVNTIKAGVIEAVIDD